MQRRSSVVTLFFVKKPLTKLIGVPKHCREETVGSLFFGGVYF